MQTMFKSTKLPKGDPCEAFGVILDPPPVHLSRQGGTQWRRCEGAGPDTLPLLLFALVSNCGCEICTYPPGFENAKWAAIIPKTYY